MHNDVHGESQRISWQELCSEEMYRGRWVVIDEREGRVLDSDEDLGALCSRLVESRRTHCSVVLADADRDDHPGRESGSSPLRRLFSGTGPWPGGQS